MLGCEGIALRSIHKLGDEGRQLLPCAAGGDDKIHIVLARDHLHSLVQLLQLRNVAIQQARYAGYVNFSISKLAANMPLMKDKMSCWLCRS